MRALFVAAGEVLNAPRPLFVAFVEAIAQAAHSDDLREQLAARYREARRGAAATVLAILGPAANRLHGDPEIMASLVMALFDGLVLQWLLDPNETPRGEELMNALVETMTLVLEAGTGPAVRPSAARGSRSRNTKRPAAKAPRRGTRRA
jgi:hypothetical protein